VIFQAAYIASEGQYLKSLFHGVLIITILFRTENKILKYLSNFDYQSVVSPVIF